MSSSNDPSFSPDATNFGDAPSTPTGATSTTQPPELVSGPLVGLLSSHRGGVEVMSVGKQRVYVGQMQTKVKLGGKTSVASTTWAYKFECIANAASIERTESEKGGVALTQQFILDKRLSDDAARRSDTRRGNMAVNANYSLNDHSKIISRLASAVSYYSQFGTLSYEMLRNGQDGIFNRDKIDGRIEAGSNLVYIPRVTSDKSAANVWYAVVGAALGSGNRVITDSTATNAQNQAVVNAPSGSQLALGCIEALSIMANYYAASKATVLFTWAMLRGLNARMSLVGMTDEGAYMRAVFRRNRFVTSYGAIMLAGERHPAMPVPSVITMETAARFCDTFLLYCAAGTAICDPMVTHGESTYPSIFTAGPSQPNIADPEPLTPEQETASAIHLAGLIEIICGKFTKQYSKYLDGVLKGGSDQIYIDGVEGFINACFASKTSKDDRHLRHRIVAPFYWVEPQGVVGKEVASYPAQEAGFGVYCYRGEHDIEKKAWEDIDYQGEQGGEISGFHVQFTAARKNLMLQHLMSSRKDGLACMFPRQLNEESVVMCGRGEGGTFAERTMRNEDMRGYLWKRHTSQMIAPAEFVVLNKGLSFLLVVAKLNYETMMPERLFQGDAEDMMNTIKVSSIAISGLGIKNRSRPFDARITKSIGFAAAALETNRHGLKGIGGFGTAMPISSYGAGPGLNSISMSYADPRRLQLSGEAHEDTWQRVMGKVQTTVISQRLRHGRGRMRQVLELAPDDGPNIEGGLRTVMVDAPVLTGKETEIRNYFDGIHSDAQLLEIGLTQPICTGGPRPWDELTDYVVDAEIDGDAVIVTENTRFEPPLNAPMEEVYEAITYGPGINAILAAPAIYNQEWFGFQGREDDLFRFAREYFGVDCNDRCLRIMLVVWYAQANHPEPEAHVNRQLFVERWLADDRRDVDPESDDEDDEELDYDSDGE